MEYVNIVNIDSLANAIRERNSIERDRLAFEKEMFEFNKQLNIDSVKANTDMADTIASFVSRFDTINKSIDILSKNDAYFKQEIDNLKTILGNKSE